MPERSRDIYIDPEEDSYCSTIDLASQDMSREHPRIRLSSNGVSTEAEKWSP